MRVIIPVFKDSVSTAVIGPMDLLTKAGTYCNELKPGNKNTFFNVELASVSSNPVINKNFPIVCQRNISQIRKADLVIVPAMDGNIPEQLEENEKLVTWLTKMYKSGATLVSICTGAFLLASTGLLNGKSATTHWAAKDLFKHMFPHVKLEHENVIVDTGQIITCGGATSFLNLCIYLIEKYMGGDVANFSAKMLLIDKHSRSQNQFAIFSLQKNHSDDDILKVQDYIEKNPNRKFRLSELASMTSLADRTFMRRFKNATGNSPTEYIKRSRVEFAKRLLEKGSKSVSEVSYETGYADIDFFRKVFKQYTGLNPLEYKKKYLAYD